MSDVQYWMAEPGGTPEGPYDIETLRDLRSQGRIGDTTQLCRDGGSTWEPATSVLGGSAAGAAAARSATPGASPADRAGQTWAPPQAVARPGFDPAAATHPRTSLGGPITATVIGALFSPCFSGLILGIISIVQASAANDALQRGNITEYEQKAKVSRTCMIVTFVLSALGCVLGIVWVAVAIAAGGFP